MSEPTSGGMSRRSVLAMAGTAGLLLPAIGTAERARAATGRIRLTLPAPTGPHRVGTTSLRLVDRSRRDPWTSPPAFRELMVSLWYPAANGGGRGRAPWLTPASLELYKRQIEPGLQTSLDDVDFPVTHAHRDAPVRTGGRGHPVVLFSPGFRSMRAMGTALVEDLASRGYAVVTLDHTHEAQFVEFPGGRIEPSRQPAEPNDDEYAEALRVRRDDTLFVLDALVRLNRGRMLRGSLDLSRVGMFGHSFGGATAAEAMVADRRVLAGADLDGSVVGAARATDLDRPFLLMAHEGNGRDNDPSWAEFWSHLRGWRRQLTLRGSEHHTYTDLSPLAQQLIRKRALPLPVVAELVRGVGTIGADRAVAAQRAYLAAFFDLHLRGRDGRLWDGPSPRYPEITFVP